MLASDTCLRTIPCGYDQILGVMGTNVLSTRHLMDLAQKKKFTMDIVSLVKSAGINH